MRERLIELIQDSVNGCARNWAEIIADYLLANGVIVPPCKVGATVYDIGEFFYGTPSPEMYEYKADYITLWKQDPDRNEIYFSIDGMDYAFDDFGKTVFLTEKEAEQALKGNTRSLKKLKER